LYIAGHFEIQAVRVVRFDERLKDTRSLFVVGQTRLDGQFVTERDDANS